MQEIAKCALCNREPNVDSYGVPSDPNFVCSCCGVVGLNAETWNRVQSAMELARAAVWKSEADEMLDNFPTWPHKSSETFDSIFETSVQAEREFWSAVEKSVRTLQK